VYIRIEKIPLLFQVVEADVDEFPSVFMFCFEFIRLESVRKELVAIEFLTFFTTLVRYFLPDSNIRVNSCGESRHV